MEYTKGPWRHGRYANCVVTDSEIPGTQHTGHSDKECYGGNLICESIWKKEDLNLIIAAPDMYEACLSALGLLAVDNPGELPKMMGTVKEALIKAINKAEGRPPDGNV